MKLDDIKSHLIKVFNDTPQTLSDKNSDTFNRIELPCDAIDGLIWLHNQNQQIKSYWSKKDKTISFAGIGQADTLITNCIEDFSQIHKRISQRLNTSFPLQRYFGGISFGPIDSENEWSEFGRIHFLLPRFEIIQNSNGYRFACNYHVRDLLSERKERLFEDISNLDFNKQTTYRKVPHVLNRKDVPEYEQWEQMINEVQQQIEEGSIQKTVLARKSNFTFDMKIKPEALLKHLKDMTPDCFHFLFQLNQHLGFVGASPERLCAVIENEVLSEAIAGTVSHSLNPETNNLLINELKDSPKNKHEHQIVVNAVKDIMCDLCQNDFTQSDLKTVSLNEGSHLKTTFKGSLKNVGLTDVILKLHPTPAVGTYPKEALKTYPESIEPFHRGWYAGPFGWIKDSACEFTVAIRSGLIKDDKLSLYAGAGIVRQSKPQEEWEEIEIKISNFLRIFS